MRVSSKHLAAFFCAFLFAWTADGLRADGHTVGDIYYREADKALPPDDYRRQQCQLDVYAPENAKKLPVVIWFHGGGLTQGHREAPKLTDAGVVWVSVGYRLYPKGAFPSFLEDAAAATAWVLENIDQYGGDPRKVFISGHSAGGYLAAMVGMDPRWLQKYGHSNSELAGIIPVSAQVSTHFLVKKLRGDTGPEYRVVVDEYAPLTYASKDLPPICLIVGDRQIEYRNRVEENELLAASLRNLGHPDVAFIENKGKDHNTVVGAALVEMPQFINRVASVQGAPQNTSGGNK